MMEKYKIVKPICITHPDALDADGEPLSGIHGGGVVVLDPKHPATVSWLENECITPFSVPKAQTTDKKPPTKRGKE